MQLTSIVSGKTLELLSIKYIMFFTSALKTVQYNLTFDI